MQKDKRSLDDDMKKRKTSHDDITESFLRLYLEMYKSQPR